MSINVRLIRFRDAPDYLGMDRNRFNAEVRPHLVEIPIGERGIGFDRLDLDAWFEDYKLRNGRPSRFQGVKECEQGQKVSKPQKMVKGLSIDSTRESASLPGLGKAAKKKLSHGLEVSRTGSMSNWKDAINACSVMQQNVT